jgi:hypothetical protein
MIKAILLRGLYGFPLGVFIGYTITMVISLFKATEGQYLPVVPSLTAQWGTEIAAVGVQFLLMGVLGAVSAASALVWENDNLNLLQQTTLHFFILSPTMLLVAYLAHWMHPSLAGAAAYFAVFAAIYLAMWLVYYWVWKYRIRALDHKLKSIK